MNFIALKMLVGNRAKYVSIIVGLTFASLLITQQSAIFLGLMTRTFGFLTDTALPDIWVMDPKVQYIDDLKPLKETESLRVRSVQGVAWAVPLYKGLLKARLPNGTFQSCNVVGLDDETLIGGPPKMLQGQLADLRGSDAIIIDIVGAKGKLSRVLPDGERVPMKIGDTMELNDHRAVVVGICQVQRTFQSQPVIYTTFSRATVFAPAYSPDNWPGCLYEGRIQDTYDSLLHEIHRYSHQFWDYRSTWFYCRSCHRGTDFL
jgi:putative ABC transport system permease protein